MAYSAFSNQGPGNAGAPETLWLWDRVPPPLCRGSPSSACSPPLGTGARSAVGRPRAVTPTGQPALGLGPETRDRRVVKEAFFGKEEQSRKDHKALEYLLKRYKEKVILG